ncbi:hypothetical protein EJ04DRAFT_156983 [Polyplosphaeria fusca]|uniref:Uncharacterized protein n=1 Tax=Polyplosphaeria fusca TaxID=682080 RepID=A0A9P4R1Q5_9PLEO|nr:hypothetical protein EJ04DRAFT_156983 [Polyplosphaeria fusca]
MEMASTISDCYLITTFLEQIWPPTTTARAARVQTPQMLPPHNPKGPRDRNNPDRPSSTTQAMEAINKATPAGTLPCKLLARRSFLTNSGSTTSTSPSVSLDPRKGREKDQERTSDLSITACMMPHHAMLPMAGCEQMQYRHQSSRDNNQGQSTTVQL